MKKFVFSLLFATFFGFVSAQTLGVSYELSGGQVGSVAVEYTTPSLSDVSLAFGVSVEVASYETYLTAGLTQLIASPDGADVSLIGRVGIPVLNATGSALSQTYAQVGLVLFPEQGTGVFAPTFEAGLSSNLDSTVFSTWPDFYFRVGLAHRF